MSRHLHTLYKAVSIIGSSAIFLIGILGCSTEVASSVARPAVTRETPMAERAPTANVNRLEAWKDAENVARADHGRAALVGKGVSMEPMLGAGTMVVITPINFDELLPGMLVAYTNLRGTRVVHRLIAPVAGGWQVQGLNNDRLDRELVTPSNLLGVVYASLASDYSTPTEN